MATVGVALFGFGRIGQIHTRSLIDSHRAKVLYIVEEFDEAARKTISSDSAWGYLENGHGTQVVKPKDAEKVLQDARVTGVLICLPTRFHESVIELACKYKKHVFCEKPIALTVEGTKKSYQLAKAAGVTLMCGLNRRFDPAFVKVREQVANGKLGKLQIITNIARDPPAITGVGDHAGGGSMFVDMGIHCFDMINWIAGEFPIQVTAMAHANNEQTKKRNDYDVVAWLLKFPSGLIAYVDGSRNTPYGYDQRFEVLGTKSAVLAENQREYELIEKTGEGETVNPIEPLFTGRYMKSYINEVNHFLDVMQGKAKCAVPGESVINAIKSALAAEEAAKTNKVVDISP